VVELKNVSEVAVGLAYSAILLRDASLAAEVSVIEDQSDELFHQLEGWVLRAAAELEDPEELRGMLHLAAAAERIVDSAQSMCRVIEDEGPPHPIIAAALSEADEIVAEAIVAPAAGRRPHPRRAAAAHRDRHGGAGRSSARTGGSTGRARPTAAEAGDRLLAIGPEEGRAPAARVVRRRPSRGRRGLGRAGPSSPGPRSLPARPTPGQSSGTCCQASLTGTR
jgi:hypothetical protein